MKVPVTGKIVGDAEFRAVIKAYSLWAGSERSGEIVSEFGRKMAAYIGVKHGIPVNSGSSANLLACAAILRPGDEVITTALSFPTTLAPIVQHGAKPVLVDVQIPGFMPKLDSLKRAITPKTTAIVLAHTLGYPFDAVNVRKLCDEHGLYLIEDTCDSLGSVIEERKMSITDRKAGSFGHLSTLSFYPAHQMTTWEGGMVLTDNDDLARRVRSLRDWGRACWCQPGQDNACGHRFDGDYDHKYSYSALGYNLKMADFCAAIGLEQMVHLDYWKRLRQANHTEFCIMAEKLGLSEWFILPCASMRYSVSWFGIALVCREGVDRNKLQQYLTAREIGSRPVFGGNMLRQKACAGMKHRIAEELENTNTIHDRGLWVGCWPGLHQEHMRYLVNALLEFGRTQ
jgi:CDP-6-deoxy-D-xylo-4-hexulose-3-dehydrase